MLKISHLGICMGDLDAKQSSSFHLSLAFLERTKHTFVQMKYADIDYVFQLQVMRDVIQMALALSITAYTPSAT